jgi:hypothetical protein
MRKILSVFLIIALTACLFAGCGETVDKIADNVIQAAKDELVAQVKLALEENKLEVIEVKTAYGKLNDNGSDMQFFVAALVRTEKTDIIEASLVAPSKVFTDTGILAETDSSIDSTHLVHKTLSYDHSDFSDGTYYTVYAYYNDLSKFIPKGK